MIKATLSKAAQWTDATLIGQDAEFNGIAIDSRLVEPGSLFVALKGYRHDGHDYIEDAKSRGASAALVSRLVATQLPLLLAKDVVQGLGQLATVWQQLYGLLVIGVLGSNGKTTVKEMVTTILQCHYGDTAVLATQGNQNNELGVPLNLLRLNASHRAAVIEMGANSHGEITRLGNIAQPDIAIITNAGLDHVAGFGGVEGAARANGEIFATMEGNGIAILNGDDPCQPIWHSQLGKRHCLQFGLNPGADVRGYWQPTPTGGQLSIDSPWGRTQCHLNLMGQHNALNALAAVSACLVLDVGLNTIAASLESISPIKGRLKPQLSVSGALIIDDTYNANPSSLLAALEALSSLSGKKILVLGDMAELGDAAESWHTQAGYAARSAGVECLLAVGDLARFATNSFGQGASHFANNQALFKVMLQQLGPGINVLIKGSRCMELENVVENILQCSS
ncbi:UDP-N-acetylmuramoyl-tripeptide--D-alanyl-D-alanine ligase [Crenothrix sp.]|uniref:UDP-N-acetylmuramoyl-tripeptide--D-alanyl-D- alanine ligase n=1 Tax=Crenothrix sp. TaxID=3100433 RepID=UPI00374D9C7E